MCHPRPHFALHPAGSHPGARSTCQFEAATVFVERRRDAVSAVDNKRSRRCNWIKLARLAARWCRDAQIGLGMWTCKVSLIIRRWLPPTVAADGGCGGGFFFILVDPQSSFQSPSRRASSVECALQFTIAEPPVRPRTLPRRSGVALSDATSSAAVVPVSNLMCYSMARIECCRTLPSRWQVACKSLASSRWLFVRSLRLPTVTMNPRSTLNCGFDCLITQHTTSPNHGARTTIFAIFNNFF